MKDNQIQPDAIFLYIWTLHHHMEVGFHLLFFSFLHILIHRQLCPHSSAMTIIMVSHLSCYHGMDKLRTFKQITWWKCDDKLWDNLLLKSMSRRKLKCNLEGTLMNRDHWNLFQVGKKFICHWSSCSTSLSKSRKNTYKSIELQSTAEDINICCLQRKILYVCPTK